MAKVSEFRKFKFRVEITGWEFRPMESKRVNGEGSIKTEFTWLISGILGAKKQ